jgi:hypothetical protein
MSSGDTFKRVAGGQPVSFKASTWNAMLDSAEDFSRRRPGGATSEFGGGPVSRTEFHIKNNADSAVDRFGVLGISGLLISNADNPDEFKTRITFTGVSPASASHTGKFVVAVEPINPGEIGRCVLNGLTQVKVNMIESGQRWADVLDGDATQLESGNVGTAQILYAESGTGTKWAVVRLGMVPGEVVVKVRTAEAGGGWYSGCILGRAGTVDPSTNLAEGDAGGGPSADDALIENLNEVGTSGHILTDASNTREKQFLGSIRGIASDGRWIVAINGFFGGCS